MQTTIRTMIPNNFIFPFIQESEVVCIYNYLGFLYSVNNRCKFLQSIQLYKTLFNRVSSDQICQLSSYIPHSTRLHLVYSSSQKVVCAVIF